MASSKDSVNVNILLVEGVLDDHVKLMTGMAACCIALPWKTDDSLYRGYELNRTYLGRNWSWFGGNGPSVSEPESTGSYSPKSMATDPS